MNKQFETILIKNEGHVAWIRLNRPEVANAFNTLMAEELRDVFQAFISGTRQARCIVLTGTGERAFCAGGDLKQRNNMTNEAWFTQHVVFEDLARALMDCPIPLIGAINGAAYGGGTELTHRPEQFISDNTNFLTWTIDDGGFDIPPGIQT